MMKSPLRVVVVAASLLVSHAACSSDLPGQWTLSVENPSHVVVATLKVEFTEEKARSCLGGDWKILKVVSATTQDEDFFPAADPLSYQIDNEQLTIGRNELCDAYLLLKGPVGEPSVRGDYFSLGLGGGTRLGYFNLIRAR